MQSKPLYIRLALSAAATVWLCNYLYLGKYEKNNLIIWDMKAYYSYLPACFIHHDLTFQFVDSNIYKEHNYFWVKSANGARVQKVSMGMAVLYSPFFFIGHIHAYITGDEMDGWSVPYQFWLGLSSIFYCILGLWLSSRLLTRFFSSGAVALSILAIGLASNLFYYTTVEGMLGHAYSLLLFTLMLELTIRFYQKPNWGITALIGLLAGLCVLVRPSNIIIIIIPALWGVTSWKSLVERLLFWWKRLPKLLLMGVLAFVAYFPQLAYWKYVTGDWFFYSYQDERFYLNNPHILSTFFSFRKGLFIYTPIMIFAFVGFFFLKRFVRIGFITIVIYSAVAIYMVSSWWCWWYGGSYSLRAYVESFAFWIFPLAAFFEVCIAKLKNKAWVLIACVVLFICHNSFQIYQYRTSLLHWDSMTFDAWKSIQGHANFPADRGQYLRTPDYDKALKGDEEHGLPIKP